MFINVGLGGRLEKAVRSNARHAPGKNVLLRLDEETNRRLIKAKDRSRRSKTAEAYLRLKDHLERFPDFYSSDINNPGGK
ncbi:TPA: TraY domain-containing protein [Raoultella planticola]|nr:TraY domain-containing protein [Raoultella planticola]